MIELSTRKLSVRRGSSRVLNDIDFRAHAGRFTALVGPNGSGKSTLLLTMARILPPASGSVRIDGRPVDTMATKQFARHVALLPQNPQSPDALTVRELVGHGRYPWRGRFGAMTANDLAQIDQSIQRCGMTDLSDRVVSRLSGGQRQRAWIAMTLAQDTPIIMLDEPTNFLDLAYQLEVLDLLRGLNRELGKTIIVVIHDLGLAARYADEIAVLDNGRILASGAHKDVLSPDLLSRVFRVDAFVDDGPQGVPLIVPLRSLAENAGADPGEHRPPRAVETLGLGSAGKATEGPVR